MFEVAFVVCVEEAFVWCEEVAFVWCVQGLCGVSAWRVWSLLLTVLVLNAAWSPSLLNPARGGPRLQTESAQRACAYFSPPTQPCMHACTHTQLPCRAWSPCHTYAQKCAGAIWMILRCAWHDLTSLATIVIRWRIGILWKSLLTVTCACVRCNK
jgi:hypothetical protein